MMDRTVQPEREKKFQKTQVSNQKNEFFKTV